MKKIHSSSFSSSTDLRLIYAVERIHELQIQNVSTDAIYKKLCNGVRESLGETCVIGFSMAIDKKTGEDTVLVHHFEEVEATEDNFFPMYMDKESNVPFIMVNDNE